MCLAHWGMTVSPGRSFPLGATLVDGGVNFCVFSAQGRAGSSCCCSTAPATPSRPA